MRRRSAVVFAGYTLLLLALCLYPFRLGPKRPFLAWEHLSSNRFYADVAANVWIYALLGALGVVTFGRNWRGFVTASSFGIALSCAVEFTQQWIPGRYSTGTDLAANSLGSVLGAAALWLTANRRADIARPAPSLSRDGALLLALWLFWQGYPFVPDVHMADLLDSYRDLRDLPWWGAGSWQDASQALAGFLMLAVAVKPRFWRAIAFAILPLQGALETQIVRPARIAAAAIAWAAVEAIGERFPQAARVAPAAVLTWLAAEELRPFHFSTQAQPLNLLPFENILDGSDAPYLPVLAKLFLYTAALWTLERCGWSLRRSLGWMGLVLLVGEWAQRWIPGRTPELTTDIALLGAGSVLLWWTRGSISGSASPDSVAQSDNLSVREPHVGD